MLTRTLLMLVASAGLTNVESYAQQATSPDVTGFVVLEMSGEVAMEYLKLTHPPAQLEKMNQGLSIAVIATVTQQLENGRIRLEHSTTPYRENGAPDRLVTLSAVVKSSDVKKSETTKNTATYSSPAAQKAGEKPSVIEDKIVISQFILELTDLKNVKLRSWTLASEIGN